MTIKVEFGIFGFSTDEPGRPDVEGKTIDAVYRIFDDVQCGLGGAIERKLFIKPHVNGVQTSEDPIGDTTTVNDGDLVQFIRIPPPDYKSSRRPPSPWQRLKWRFRL